MEIIIVLAFVGLMLVAGMLLLFAHGVHNRSDQHADRLALLPIQDDAPVANGGLEDARERS